ncbi:MAG: hypothetical protein M3Z05_03640 [Gemmatimonadota bacterium]|nr:hypothetical protein [Gemmatimonadota bacterium]
MKMLDGTAAQSTESTRGFAVMGRRMFTKQRRSASLTLDVGGNVEIRCARLIRATPVRSTPVIALPRGLIFSIDAIAVAERSPGVRQPVA